MTKSMDRVRHRVPVRNAEKAKTSNLSTRTTHHRTVFAMNSPARSRLIDRTFSCGVIRTLYAEYALTVAGHPLSTHPHLLSVIRKPPTHTVINSKDRQLLPLHILQL